MHAGLYAIIIIVSIRSSNSSIFLTIIAVVFSRRRFRMTALLGGLRSVAAVDSDPHWRQHQFPLV